MSKMLLDFNFLTAIKAHYDKLACLLYRIIEYIRYQRIIRAQVITLHKARGF